MFTVEAWGDLTFLILSRGYSLSACHSCHSPRPSGDTGIVAGHHSDPELPGAWTWAGRGGVGWVCVHSVGYKWSWAQALPSA